MEEAIKELKQILKRKDICMDIRFGIRLSLEILEKHRKNGNKEKAV